MEAKSMPEDIQPVPPMCRPEPRTPMIKSPLHDDGRVLRGLRLAGGLTVDHVSQQTCQSADVIYRIERGLRSPTVEELRRLAVLYHFELPSFFDPTFRELPYELGEPSPAGRGRPRLSEV